MKQDEMAIRDTIAEIAKTYSENDLVCMKKTTHLPSRNALVAIIKDFRKILFPGYFDDVNVGAEYAEYYIGEKLVDIRERLKRQVILALKYYNTEDTEEEIAARADAICTNWIKKVPYMQQMLLKDVQAGFDGDPAAKSKEDIIFSYPGLFAIYVYRMAHELYVQNVPFIPRMMTEYAHGKTGIDINSGATIGEYFFIDHGTGVVIGETTIIGNYVKLYQGVTLGALSTRSGQLLKDVKRHPTIEDHVTIYAGSTILGGETVIGHNTTIGGNSFITQSIAPNMRVSAINPELKMKEAKVKADLNTQANTDSKSKRTAEIIDPDTMACTEINEMWERV